VGKQKTYFFIIIGFVLLTTKLLAFNNDSLKVVKAAKLPKHYFNKSIYLDYYSPGTRKLDTVNTVSKKLGSYKIKQVAIGFNIPVFTKDIYNKDSTKISNIHFLITGGFSNINLNFNGITAHNLSKTAIGCRGIYNNGKKGIFFAEVTPFVTQDRGFRDTKTYRLAATILYNYAASDNFSLRFGITRSFLWGNRLHLPYVGIRIGKLDKINFSVQFPRSVSLNVPIGKYIRTSLYTKPQGGFYTFENSDSLQLGSIYEHQKLYFGRAEFLSGLRVDVLPSKYFNFYLSSGFTTNNFIAFYPSANPKSKFSSYYDNYYHEKIKSSMFLNFGLVVRFGKTRSIYNNQQMYNAIDMNNGIDPNDNGTNPGNGNIPHPSNKKMKNTADDVLDLLETQDLY
jgi:hypothetical protein